MKDIAEEVNNERNFEKVFLAISPKLKKYIFYRCGDIKKSEDLVQDAFLRLWQKFSDVPLNSVQGFVYKVATNLLINQGEKEKVHFQFRQKIERIKDTNTPQFELEYNELKQKLERAIHSLPEKQREVFLMNRMEKMTYLNIAETLEISVKTVEKRMHKALVSLKKLIENI